MSEPILWLVLVVGALTCGAAVVGMLVVRRSFEVPLAIVGSVGFGATGWAFAGIARAYAGPEAVVWAFAFSLASAVGGYALASTLLYRLASPALKASPGPPSADSTGVVVIVAACIEPSAYDPRATAGMLQSLADEGLLEASMGALPLMFFGQKARYRAVGGSSPSEVQLASVASGLERTLPDVDRVEWATCAGGDRPLDSVVGAAASRGHSRVVVAELTVAESLHLAQAKATVAGMRLDEAGAAVTYTGALADSERVVTLIARRLSESTRAPAATGVILVGHGQPEERSRRNREFDENELAFLNRVKMLLLERGFQDAMIRVAWADWSEPDVTSSVRHLAALGAKLILVCPAVYPLDTLGTRLDLEMAVRRARVADDVIATTLPAWRDDPAVIAELRARVQEALGS